MRLFLILLITATVEVVLIAKVGDLIGFFNTFLLIIGTSVLGSWQLKKQWRLVLGKLQTMQTEPSQGLLEGLVLLISGALLVVPGFLTDTIGFLGLIPTVREYFVRFLSKHPATINRSSTWAQRGSGDQQSNNSHPHQTIDGEFERKDD